MRSRVAILAMHEPRDLSYYEDLRRGLYESWSLRLVRGLDRLTGLRMDGDEWTFRLVAFGLVMLVTANLFWGFMVPRRRKTGYSIALACFISMGIWISLYSGIASLNQYDMRGAHLAQKILDVTTSWGLETDVYWEWEPFKKQWEDPNALPYTVVCWMGVPLGADEQQMENWAIRHKDRKILHFCLGAQLPRPFHAPLFEGKEAELDWSPENSGSVCLPRSAYDRHACWQSKSEHFKVKTVAWNNNIILYGRSESSSQDIQQWLIQGLEQLQHPWARLDTSGIVALRLDDPGSAINIYLETWRFPTLSAERWKQVDETLAQFGARMSVGYVPAWLDDGRPERGELRVNDQVIHPRTMGQVYPSTQVVYQPAKGMASSVSTSSGNTSSDFDPIYDYRAQAQALKHAQNIELELHGFSHITPEPQRWSTAKNQYENSDWYREFLGTEQRPFVQRSDVVQSELLHKGRQWFYEAFQQWPVAFIPPGHAISWDTPEIAFRKDFIVHCDRHLVFNANGQVRRSRLLYSQDLAEPLAKNANAMQPFPAVLYLHDRDLYRENPTWLADHLTRWQLAGVKKFVSLREWADLWLATPKVSFTAKQLILESAAWPEALKARVRPQERVSVFLHLPNHKKLGPLPEGLSLGSEGQISWEIQGQALRWEIPWLERN